MLTPNLASTSRVAARFLPEGENLLASVVASAVDAIVVLDCHGQTILFNSAAERMFHFDSRFAIGRVFTDLLSGELSEVLLKRLGKEAPPPDTDGLLQAYARRNDGKTLSIEASLSVTGDADECFYTLILRNSAGGAELPRQGAGGQRRHSRIHLAAQPLVGSSPALRTVMDQVAQVAATEATVLITGETGTGKELVAAAIHDASNRQENPMIKLNCAAMPAGLVESELFGHERGAFTGAVGRKPGRFERAHGGTLFLDEIGELPLEAQAKLLRVLNNGELDRIGGVRTLQVDVRIIAATNRDLKTCVRQGHFRADLYYRLNVFPISIPPLRKRPEDIEDLTRYFVDRYAVRYKKEIETIPKDLLKALERHSWPGNIRELQHLLERAVILTGGPQLAFPDNFEECASAPFPSRPETLEEVEREHILRILDETDWRVSGRGGAAALLGLKPTTLESRMKRLGIDRAQRSSKESSSGSLTAF